MAKNGNLEVSTFCVSEGTEVDSEGEEVEVPHGLLHVQVGARLGVRVVPGQRGAAVAPDRLDGLPHGPGVGARQQLLAPGHQQVAQLDKVF